MTFVSGYLKLIITYRYMKQSCGFKLYSTFLVSSTYKLKLRSSSSMNDSEVSMELNPTLYLFVLWNITSKQSFKQVVHRGHSLWPESIRIRISMDESLSMTILTLKLNAMEHYFAVEPFYFYLRGGSNFWSRICGENQS